MLSLLPMEWKGISNPKNEIEHHGNDFFHIFIYTASAVESITSLIKENNIIRTRLNIYTLTLVLFGLGKLDHV